MEKELKLSHIQHYPIGGENAIEIVQLGDEPEILKVNGVIDIDGKLVICANDNDFDYNSDMKLLLLPMSDLCKPLEDGSIPIVELAKIAFPKKKFTLGKSGCWCGAEKFMYCESTCSFTTLKEDGGCFSDGSRIINQLQLFEYLFKHHFNVFNLSPDLYIDIKTIEK